MLVRHANGETRSDEFGDCRDLIMWYVGCEDDRETVAGAELRVITDDGKVVTIFIPNDASTRVSIRWDSSIERLSSERPFVAVAA
ncbi:MAG: hypothetical protein JWQ98_594 [Chlorobi bacterium]|nr:hypothetical protein [Chlorobiota bacterium]